MNRVSFEVASGRPTGSAVGMADAGRGPVAVTKEDLHMARVEVRDEIDTDINRVWDLVADFGGVNRISPDIQSCEVEGDGVGAVRTINTNGILIQERLERLDEESRTFSYSMLEGPIPFKNYLATVTLREAGPRRTAIQWAGSFEPAGIPEEQLKQLVEGIYRQLIAGIKGAVASS
jgi:hypothetical protein